MNHSESDPLCTVPASYLMHLQGLINGAAYSLKPPGLVSRQASHVFEAIEGGATPGAYEQVCADRDRYRDERDGFAEKIAEFEFRAGCALENIPVEELGRVQDICVNQDAIDHLKATNDELGKRLNASESEMVEYRGRWKEVLRELEESRAEIHSLQGAVPDAAARVEAKHAPYGFKKDGTPKKKSGPRKRKRKG